MKLSGPEASRFIERPDRTLAGVLIYGVDPVEISERRARLVRALLGPGDGRDLRLTRISGADLRRDPALLLDAMTASGFFDGPRVVTVEDVGDGHAATVSRALSEAVAGDGFIVATAGALPARSKLRKAFEDAPNAASAPVYSDRVSVEEIAHILAEAGGKATREALEALQAFGALSGAGALRELATRLALFHLDDDGEISADDVELCKPGGGDGDIDGLIDMVLLGRSDGIAGALGRLRAQGQSEAAVGRILAWRIRQLHTVLAAGGAPDAAIGKLRPPVFGARRDVLARAARIWSEKHIENAISLVLELESTMRGGADVSGFALLERSLLKIALTGKSLTH